jgi:hypothetical protein
MERLMKDSRECNGPVFTTSFGRRSFIQVGVLGGLGLSLAELFHSEARASVVRSEADSGRRPEGRAKSVIQIVLPGGMAHQESWDPKPEAPIEYRGPLGVVKTKLPGVVFSENLSRTAQIADKITVVRSITGHIPDHQQATYLMFTGYLPTPAIRHPSIGSAVNHRTILSVDSMAVNVLLDFDCSHGTMANKKQNLLTCPWCHSKTAGSLAETSKAWSIPSR